MNETIDRVLVSVLNWNSWENTFRCLDSLYMMEANYFTVVVVDNASEEPVPERFSVVYPLAVVLKNPENLGFAGGHKTAVDWGMNNGYQNFWILNNDLLVHPRALTTLRAAVGRNGDQALYGSLSIEGQPPVPINPGYLLNYHGGVNFHTSGQDMARAIRKAQKSASGVLQVGTLYGCSLFFTGTLIQNYGFMRTEFFMYAEEVDYALSLFKKNVPSFLVIDSLVYHTGQQNNKRSLALNTVLGYYIARNTFYSRRRLGRFGACYFSVFRSMAHFVKNLAKHVNKGLCHVPNNDLEHGLAGMLGVWHALIGKTGKTLQPEHALKIGNRPYFGSYARTIKLNIKEDRA